jgi:hypothetical protein
MTTTEFSSGDRGRTGVQTPRVSGSLYSDNPVAAPQSRSGTDRSANYAHILRVIRRIEGYIDEETTALSSGLEFDLVLSNNRKSQSLVDLSSAVRGLSKVEGGEELQTRLSALRESLNRNLRVVRMHLNAVKEISDVLSDAIQSADSDGTYRPSRRAS